MDRPLTLNRYVYALNNPINYVDPTGQRAVAVPLLGLGALKWLLPVFAVPGAGQVLVAGAAVAIAVIATVLVVRAVAQEAPALPFDWERERDKIIERLRDVAKSDPVPVPWPRKAGIEMTLYRYGFEGDRFEVETTRALRARIGPVLYLTDASHYTQVETHWTLALEGPYRDAKPPPAYTGGREYLTPSPPSPDLIRVAYVGPVPLGFLP